MILVLKTLYTLNINYSPEICELTYPLLKCYARRLGADFYVISEDKFPGWPVVYNKLQIGELARKRRDDWSVFIDSDCLVHPETIDFTEHLPRDTVAHNGSDMASVRWRYDDYFRRDGRNIGSCTWMVFCSSWCLDLWQPLDMPLEQALENIQPTVGEATTTITPDHLIDDYALSRNIARYGLKYRNLKDLIKDLGIPDANFFWHLYTLSVEEKVRQMKEILEQWSIDKWFKKCRGASAM